MAELDPDQVIARFRERAQAVRDRGLPPVAGDERRRLIEAAETDFLDFALDRCSRMGGGRRRPGAADPASSVTRLHHWFRARAVSASRPCPPAWL